MNALASATVCVHMHGIQRTYRAQSSAPVPVLRGVECQVVRGEFVALMGPSGSGKTTLLHIIAGLDRADAGSYLLDGVDVTRCDDDALSALRSRRIGMVFQAFHLIAEMNVCDNVALPLLYQRVSGAERQRRARAALERVGLGHRWHHRPQQMSGGEQQRVAIARALIANPALLIADEPTGNLDSAKGQEIIGLFRELHAQGLTIVMVTHDAAIAAQAQRVVRMRDGLIVDHQDQR